MGAEKMAHFYSKEGVGAFDTLFNGKQTITAFGAPGLSCESNHPFLVRPLDRHCLNTNLYYEGWWLHRNDPTAALSNAQSLACREEPKATRR